MAKSKKTIVENEAIDNEEVQQDEVPQETPVSDHKLILAPLARYGVVAIIMASIIVTTAIMMNREFNDIDVQVAGVEAEIAQHNQTEQLAQEEVSESIAIVEEASGETAEAIASNVDTTPAATLPEVVLPVASAPTPEVVLPVASAPMTPAAVTMPSQRVYKTVDHKTRMAEHHEFMAKQDQKQLDLFKANQSKQIEMLRTQLVEQQERINAIEKRNLESYAKREAAFKRNQEAREQSLNRI